MIWRRDVEGIGGWFQVRADAVRNDFSPHNPSGPHAGANDGVATQEVELEMLLILRGLKY
jgi:hypothetical protein